jgi:hypothetical protein
MISWDPSQLQIILLYFLLGVLVLMPQQVVSGCCYINIAGRNPISRRSGRIIVGVVNRLILGCFFNRIQLPKIYTFAFVWKKIYALLQVGKDQLDLEYHPTVVAVWVLFEVPVPQT